MKLFSFLKRKENTTSQTVGSSPFVISLSGEVFSDLSGRTSDIQLASGAEEVMGAGRWVVTQGKLLALTNESPAFQPSFDQMKEVVEFLAKTGMDLSGNGKGVLLLVYSNFDANGQGYNQKSYRVKVSSDSILYLPE
jgi:hypothetical protein